ncbi:MAG: hypothetical protein ACXWF2_00705 [Usitatibacter sp.]
MRSRFAAACFASIATLAAALDTAQWPPPEGVEARMRELQQVIGSRDLTMQQRDAAREELAGLLKSPAGRQRRSTGEQPQHPARAAIEPYPSVVKPVNVAPPPAPPPPSPGVAHVEVIAPSKPIVDPQTGTVITPAGRFAVDPRTGNVLHEAGPGFIDPRTGQLIPR